MSIFEQYYTKADFVDRYAGDPHHAVDVVIPVYHTNELWRANLLSIYREIPVRRLLISDGGCVDNSIDVVREFPRVEVFDHRSAKTLGICIAELIKQVTADWFVYLHSDVYLPEGWFDQMVKHQGQYDWFGCPMNITVMVNYRLDCPDRPYAGSQMGRRAAFFPSLNRLEDDFVYRQEDFVFKQIVEDNGFKEGKIEDTFHYHQVMFRQSKGFDLNVQAVNVICKTDEAEKKRATVMQLYGLIKYVRPSTLWLINNFSESAFSALDNGYLSFDEIDTFIGRTNPEWKSYFNRRIVWKRKLRAWLTMVKRLVERSMR